MSDFAKRFNSFVNSRFRPKQEVKEFSKEVHNGIESANTRTYKEYDSFSQIDEKHLKVVAVKLSAFPLALDMLVFILQTLIDKTKANEPIDKKFREIKATTEKFKASVGKSEEWGDELLKLAGFERAGEWYRLTYIDPGKLWICKSILEAEKDSTLYKFEKQKVIFEKLMKDSINDFSTEEAGRRAEMGLRVPPEPTEGSMNSSRIFVFLGSKMVKRLFNGDDMLHEVLMWIGANYGSMIPEKLQERQYELINKSLYPGKPIDYNKESNNTLYGLQLTPSAELHIQLSGMFEAERLLQGVSDNT